MEEVTVKCGCGRTMALDGRRGRGAFRCGCGVTIQIQEAKRNHTVCVGTAADGTQCRTAAVGTDPLPLCGKCYASTGLRQYHQWCKLSFEDIALDVASLQRKAQDRARTDASFDPTGRIERAAKSWVNTIAQHAADLASSIDATDQERSGTIYFIGIGELIKIGKTLNLTQRLGQFSYPHLKVLATEPGYTLREAQLHNQFAACRHRGEWFHTSPELLAYIATLPSRRAEVRRTGVYPKLVPADQSALLPVTELARVFGIPAGTIRGWISQDKLPWQLQGRLRAYSVADIQGAHDRRHPA